MSYAISLSGLQNAQTDLSVIGNNIANANTTGFKESNVQFANLVAASAYSNPKDIQGIGSTVSAINQNFSQGPINQTGSALDLAITGDGFFTVTSPITTQTYYTRNGNFSLDSTTAATSGNSYIVDSNGNRLQALPTSATGTVTSTTPTDATVPATDAAGSAFSGVTIAANGNISASYADGSNTVIGKVALAAFAAPEGLKQVGSADYTATGLSGTATFGAPNSGQYGSLLSGSLEASNVDLSSEMVNLITAQQYFQANAKAIDTNTTVSQAIINLHS
jgi:flagellar hook protein FlgE